MTKNVGGRPTDFTPELAREICDIVASTPAGIEKICKIYPHLPRFQTIYKWRDKHPTFNEDYARAKQQQIEAYVDQLIDIADDASNDYTVDEEGKEVLNTEHIQRSRLRIDTRKWLASKLMPKLYGGKGIEISAEGSLLEKFIDKL